VTQAETAADRLRGAVEGSLPALRRLTEEQSARPRAPGKWSPKEIIGHLIDSASNNHQRFVRARFQEDLVFPGYRQEEWVRNQGYGGAPWADLVDLWRLYNQHLARVMAAVPEEIRLHATRRHNFHEIASEKFPEGEPVCLDDLMHDYVRHLEHHLAQIPDR